MKTPTPSSAPHAQLVWYIQAVERVWGPYPQARLGRFVIEKRLTADSLIATHPAGPFGPAGRRGELRRLFEPFATLVEAPLAIAKPPAPVPSEPPAQDGREPSAEAGSKLGRESGPELAVVTPAQPRSVVFPRRSPQLETSAKARLHARALVVWADLTSVSTATFEVALAGHGAFVGVRPGVWLIRAGTDASSLRNALSRALTGEDALLVIEAPLDCAAWFNLDHEAELNLRQLWGGVEGRG